MKRRIKSKNTLIIISSLFIAGSMIGCGNKADDGLTIHFWHTFGQDIQNTLTSKINKFEELVLENTGDKVDIVLDYQGGYDDIKNKIIRGFSSGDTPTIAVAYPDHVAEYLSSETTDGEYVVNLEKYMEDANVGFGSESYLNEKGLGSSDFIESFLNEGQNYIKEGTYSLPLMKSTEVMFYDQENVFRLLQDYDPSIGNKEAYLNSISFDEFMNILRFAKKDLSKYGTNLEVPLIYDSDSNLYITNTYQESIPYVSQNNGKGNCDFVNAKAKAMVEKLKGYYDEGLFLTKGTNNNEYGSNKFTASQCLFSIGSSGGAGYNDPGAASFTVGISKVPAFNQNNVKYISQGPTLTLLNSHFIDSETNTRRVDYAWKFLKYITNTQNSSDICIDSNGYIPVRKSSFETDDYKNYLLETDFLPRCSKVVYNEINGNYLNYPVFKGTATARNEVGGIITQVFLEKKSVDTAFDDAKNNTLIAMN